MPPTSQFFQVSAPGNLGKLEPVREHRQCLLFLSRIIDNRSYHDFFGITTFDHKAGKLKEFLKKVGIIFCNRHQFLVFETDNISLKVGITFFSECVKSAILLKNEFSNFAFLNKSSIFNGLSKRLSRLFTAIASLEEFINGRKVTHIITTFFRGNGANTTFLIKSHDTKKVGITITSRKRFLPFRALEKKRNFFEESPHRGDITLSTINIRNSGERG